MRLYHLLSKSASRAVCETMLPPNERTWYSKLRSQQGFGSYEGERALAPVCEALSSITGAKRRGTGVHESIIPATVAPMVPPQRRASAYGLFTTGYGVFWFLGSALIGILYGVLLPVLIAFSVVVELAAIPLFMLVRRQSRSVTTAV